MLIAIDARFYQEAGPGRYIKNILFNLEKLDSLNYYLVFLKKPAFDLYQPSNHKFTKIEADYPWYSFKEQVFFLIKLMKFKPDLLYVPHFNIPILFPGAVVSAIPDLIMHDFSTEEATTLPKPYYRFKKIVYHLVVLFALIRSKKVIVPSKATISDILKHYPFIEESKFLLSYEGVDSSIMGFAKSQELLQTASTILSEFEIKEPFLLYVGSMYRHKNLKKLVDAFLLLRSKYKFLGQLIIIGKKDAFSLELEREIESRNLDSLIKMPGQKRFINDSEISYLRKKASVYVFPSLKEGFSLTPLEAMVFDLPCVISKIACHEEVYGNSVEYFDPKSEESMALSIHRVLTDENLREFLRSEGRKVLEKYTFEKTAQDTLNCFNSFFKNS